MVKEIEREGVTIRLELNQDGSVNLNRMMLVSWLDEFGKIVSQEMYPTVHVTHFKNGESKAERYGRINDQFELAEAVIKFEYTYNKRERKDLLKSYGLDYKILGNFFGYKSGSFENSTRRDAIELGVLKVINYIQEGGKNKNGDNPQKPDKGD